MSQKRVTDLIYNVKTKGMPETKQAIDNVKNAANEAAKEQEKLDDVSRSTMSVSMTLVREVNASRLAIVQAHKAITELDPVAALYAFLNVFQVVSTMIPLMKTLRAVSTGAAVAQGVVATLSGMWWLIPLAIAAGAAILAFLQFSGRSMQRGGVVEEEGWYYLHRKEVVINPCA